VIPLNYDWINSFYEGLAKAQLNGKIFYINKEGKCVKNCEINLQIIFNKKTKNDAQQNTQYI
jgi:hypothetical protein